MSCPVRRDEQASLNPVGAHRCEDPEVILQSLCGQTSKAGCSSLATSALEPLPSCSDPGCPVPCRPALSPGEIRCCAETRPGPSLVTPCSLPSTPPSPGVQLSSGKGGQQAWPLGLGFLPEKAVLRVRRWAQDGHTVKDAGERALPRLFLAMSRRAGGLGAGARLGRSRRGRGARAQRVGWRVIAALLSQSLPPRPPVWQMGRPRPQAGPLPS